MAHKLKKLKDKKWRKTKKVVKVETKIEDMPFFKSEAATKNLIMALSDHQINPGVNIIKRTSKKNVVHPKKIDVDIEGRNWDFLKRENRPKKMQESEWSGVMTRQEVLKITKLHKNTIYKYEKAGEFPQRFKISSNRYGYDWWEIWQWIEHPDEWRLERDRRLNPESFINSCKIDCHGYTDSIKKNELPFDKTIQVTGEIVNGVMMLKTDYKPLVEDDHHVNLKAFAEPQKPKETPESQTKNAEMVVMASVCALCIVVVVMMFMNFS